MIAQHAISIPLVILGAKPLILNFAAWTCLAFAGFALLITWMNRRQMTNLYSSARYKACHAVTWLLGMQAERVRYLVYLKWVSTIVGIYGLIHHFESSPSPFQTIGESLVYAILLLNGCIQFFGQERPAAIVLLAACQERTLRLHVRLRDAAWPHRVVSLLETKKIRSNFTIAGDCFRITFGKWERAISRLIRSCIIVVVDLRVITPAVTFELQEIIKQGVQFKTILIGTSPTSAQHFELRLCSYVGSEEECCALLKSVLTEKMILPSDAQPIIYLAEHA